MMYKNCFLFYTQLTNIKIFQKSFIKIIDFFENMYYNINCKQKVYRKTIKIIKEKRKMRKAEEISRIKDDANNAKHRLIELEMELYELGAIREANTLGTIIAKLEIWQNK